VVVAEHVERPVHDQPGDLLADAAAVREGVGSRHLGAMYTSPARGAPGGDGSSKLITSVGPRWRRCRQLRRAISPASTNVIERSARRDPFRRHTSRASSATRSRPIGTRTPTARTSTSIVPAASRPPPAPLTPTRTPT
jgi:hypothetical protein